MKSKKFVLAGLALLAITGLLALAGCKNDSVPETSAAKLVSITITPPARTVYSVGQSFDPTGMVVTATYNDGESKDVTSLATTNFDTVAGEKGLGKTVTVSYTEEDTTETDTFTVDVASYQFTETVQDVDSSYTGTMTEGTYKKFGEWPQTIKEEDVEIGAGTLVRGGLTYHVGSDGNYYVEAEEKANDTGTQYKYSNGEQVGQGGTSTKWFKVEPIVWRVLNKDYKTTGTALLLAESILTGGIPYYDVYNVDRTVGEATIHPNNYEHSAVRAWLNGLEYEYKKDANTAQTTEKKYLAAGFLQTAFTADAQSLIADTTVDNGVTSTFGTGEKTEENPYACDKTNDKIFLLSQQEATNSGYGFAIYNKSGKGSTRIRVTTDYAKATGAYHRDSTEGYGGWWWWLRSPYYGHGNGARVIDSLGNASNFNNVNDSNGGVVPALSISLK